MDYQNINVGDLVRYQYCMNDYNYYEKVTKITNSYLVLENGAKFRKKDGWGTSNKSGFYICGINDSENEEVKKQDLANIYYY